MLETVTIGKKTFAGYISGLKIEKWEVKEYSFTSHFSIFNCLNEDQDKEEASLIAAISALSTTNCGRSSSFDVPVNGWRIGRPIGFWS